VESTTVKQKAISADRLGKFYLTGELPFFNIQPVEKVYQNTKLLRHVIKPVDAEASEKK